MRENPKSYDPRETLVSCVWFRMKENKVIF